MDMQIVAVAAVVVVVFLALIASRFGGGYGKIRPSQEITEAYGQFRVNPARRYYISGSDVYPNAILAIDKSWTLEADLWKPRELDSQGLKELVQNMRAKAMESMAMLNGFTVHDHRGTIMGDWFSLPGLPGVVKITGASRVRIDTPPLDSYSCT